MCQRSIREPRRNPGNSKMNAKTGPFQMLLLRRVVVALLQKCEREWGPDKHLGSSAILAADLAHHSGFRAEGKKNPSHN